MTATQLQTAGLAALPARWTAAGAVTLALTLGGCVAHQHDAAGEAAPAAAVAKVSPIPAETIGEMEARALRAIAEGDTPGVVLVAGHAGEVAEIKAFGNRSLEPDVPMTADTVFDLASVSKVVGTATAAMLLIEDGKMSLDTRIADIIPEFGQNGKDDVRVRDLLTHSSGLKPYEDWKKAEEIRGDSPTDDALIRRIASLEKQYETGRFVNYSCLNYLTLARVNETVAGESQESLLRRRVWKPLGMNDTAYVLRPDMIARWAPTFKTLPEERFAGSTHDPLAFYYKSTTAHCPGNAGLFSTGPDLAKWCQMILNEGELNGVRVFKPETIRMMTTAHASLPKYNGLDEGGKPKPGETWNRALGFHVYVDPPYTSSKGVPGSWIGHTGYTGTYFWMDKQTNSYVLVLTNAVYSHDPTKITPTRKDVTAAMVKYLYGPEPAQEPAKVAQ